MKKTKLFISMILIALMLVNAVTVFATISPSFEVETVNAEPGESVEVAILIKNNPGIASIGLEVEYDSSLTLTDIKYNTDVDGTFTLPSTMTSPVKLNWVDTKDSNKDWKFATLTFLVSNDVNSSEKADISITYDPNDIYDFATETNVYFEVKNGAVNISVPSVGCSHTNTTSVLAKESTCTEQGNEAYTKCEDCGKIISGSNAKLPLLDHNYTELAKEEYLASTATCIAKEKYFESCSDCGHKGDETFEYGEIDADNHNLIEVKAKKEAHEANGNIAYFDCEYCEKYFADSDAKTEIALEDTVVLKGEHSYSTEYKSDSKNHWKECDCGDTIEKAAHSFGDWVVTKEATRTQNGRKERICSVCDYKETKIILSTYRPSSSNNSTTSGKTNTQSGGSTGAITVFAVLALSVIGTGLIFKKKK